MTNYQLITDLEKLKDFIEWLPDLGPHEKFYLALFGRNKYADQAGHTPHFVNL
jgi:hypothetical protein